MKNEIIVINSNSTYSTILIKTKKGVEKHYISNNGWFPIEYWVNKFKKEYNVKHISN